MSIRALIERLVQQGMDPIDAAEVVTEAALLGAAANSKDGAAEKRRAYDRERKRKSTGIPPEDNSALSTGIPPETAASRTGTQVVTPSLPSLRSEELKPLTHPSGASPPKAKPGRSRLVPDSWTVPEKVMTDLTVQGFSPGEIERELANFRDHEFRDPKTAWDLAFRKWMRNSRTFQPRKAPHERFDPDAKRARREANSARSDEGAYLAARQRFQP